MSSHCLLIWAPVALLPPTGKPEKQKEADEQHRALAAKSGSLNDFATLLSVFQSCKSRYSTHIFFFPSGTWSAPPVFDPCNNENIIIVVRTCSLHSGTSNFTDDALAETFFLVFVSDRPSSWCKENWIHWRALKSAFSVETQLREILLRLKQVQQLGSFSL